MKTTTLEQSLQDRILYIGTEIPDAVAKDTRQKFVLLGTPQELINEHLNVKIESELEKKYNELLYAVVQKWPNETRHETALRYIKERETIEQMSECRLD